MCTTKAAFGAQCPLWTIDTYEHAYFMDYGSDRPSYITALLKNVDWDAVNARYQAAKASLGSALAQESRFCCALCSGHYT